MPVKRSRRRREEVEKRWRWRVPPPEHHNIDLAEGVRIFDELPGATGILIWQLARDVNAWAMAEPDDRGNLFGPQVESRRKAAIESAGEDVAEIEAPLHALATMTLHAGIADGSVVTSACQRVSEWAEARGASTAALAFEQAAAIASPDSAPAAYRVGKLLRRRADYGRAEVWLQWAVMLGRQSDDRETQARAYSGLGNLHVMKGSYPTAERQHQKAMRLAVRHSFRELSGQVAHDMFTLCAITGREEEALAFARTALQEYIRAEDKQRLTRFANDLAMLWIQQAHFERAVRLLTAVLPHEPIHSRQYVYGNIAHAAAGLGDRELFEQYWTEASELLEATPVTERHTRTWIGLGRAAIHLEDWSRAETAARNAMQIAESVNEAETSFEAEQLLQTVRERRAQPLDVEPARPAPAEADRLVTDFVAALSA